MITSLNYTSRIEIDRSMVSPHIAVSPSSSTLHLVWNLSMLELDPTSELIAELSDVRSTRTRRIPLGKIRNGVGEETENVSDFSNLTSIRIRFKVVLLDSKKRLRILASIDKVRPALPPEIENAFSLLNIEADETLSVPWVLKFDSGEPILYISKKNNLFDQLRNPTSAPWFFPLVVHEVARQVFNWLCLADDLPNSSVAKIWQDFFISFGCDPDFFINIETGSDSENQTARDIQLDKVLGNFVRANGILENISKFSKLEEN
jgi:hypothetical protein